MSEQPQDQAGDEVQMPDETVEDLEPGEGEADDVTGGRSVPKGGWDLGSNTKI